MFMSPRNLLRFAFRGSGNGRDRAQDARTAISFSGGVPKREALIKVTPE